MSRLIWANMRRYCRTVNVFRPRNIKLVNAFAAYVKAVESGPHGPEIILSRADPQFVIKLFQLEVSEINDGTIEIKGIAREPGFRTKLAVYTRDPKVDPVGACVGFARPAGEEYCSRAEQ